MAGRLGDQHKVPRVTNGRSIVEAVLATAAGSTRDAVMAVG